MCDKNVECDVCGGGEFYKEAGHYYCKECQTQTQELQEHVFEEEITKVNIKSTRKVTSAKKEKTENKITSWECFNVILVSLTDELINLGADSKLKPVVKCLWMKYLRKLQVFNFENDMPPKLQATGVGRIDAKILYGVKRRRRSRSSSESATTSVNSSSKRERSKRKRALVQQHYEDFTQKSTQGSSLHNETLSSLKTESEKADITNRITYNIYNTKIIRKRMSRMHLKKHRTDLTDSLTCHKFRCANFPKEFIVGSQNLTINKMYIILYLGLLITKDKIQLGDLLRFLREGHLSFNKYCHMFPEEYAEKFLNLPSANSKLFVSKNFREFTAKMAKFLNVVGYMEIPDIVELSHRYCRELNLPDEIYEFVKKLLAQSLPDLKFTKQSTLIPNYEARTISFVLFTLKLFYGLDGVTEYKISSYASQLNEILPEKQMFNIVKWLEYISYRDSVVSKNHFPTSFSKDPRKIDSDLYLEYIKSNKINLKPTLKTKMSKEMKNYKEVLCKLVENANDDKEIVEFTPTLTPFLDYTDIILTHKTVYKRDVLKRNFIGNSLEFLLKPNKYLEIVNNRTVKNGNANENIIVKEILTLHDENQSIRYDRQKLVPVEIIQNGEERHINEFLTSRKKKKKNIDSNVFLSNWTQTKQTRFELNNRKLSKLSKLTDVTPNSSSDKIYEEHYRPFERTWLYLRDYVGNIPKENISRFVDNFPHTFKIVLRECLRIVEQQEMEFLLEYRAVELYLTFVEEYGKNEKRNYAVDSRLRAFVDYTVKHW